MKRALVALLALTLVGLLTVELRNESTRKLIFDSNGWIYEGTAFGVTVGDRRDVAAQILSLRYRLVETSTGNRSCTNGDGDYRLDVYEDGSWRGGNICLVTRDDEVVAVSWMFQPVAL